MAIRAKLGPGPATWRLEWCCADEATKVDELNSRERVRMGNAHRKYEGTNLLFFLVFILALGVFVAWVFQSYKTRGERPERAHADDGIVTEAVSETSGSCLFYLGAKVSEKSSTYMGPSDIPHTDDGMVKDFFSIPGVVEVTVDQRLIVLQKAPSAHWEEIQPAAREIIRNHLHLHR